MITVEETFIIERLRTLGFLFRFSDPLCWKCDGACLLRNCVLFDEGLNLSRERVMKSRCRTAVFCCVSTVQHHGVIFQVYCMCLLRPIELTVLFVPTYTKLSSVFDHVGELKHCQPVVLCGLCGFFLLYFLEKHLQQTVIGETRYLTVIFQHWL